MKQFLKVHIQELSITREQKGTRDRTKPFSHYGQGIPLNLSQRNGHKRLS